MPELEGDRVYNTCLVLNPEGGIVARHRKVHLFDIDVAATESRAAMKFKELQKDQKGMRWALKRLERPRKRRVFRWFLEGFRPKSRDFRCSWTFLAWF